MKNNLKEFRKKQNISQISLAKNVGISRVYLSYIENGKVKPSVDIAYKIAKELNESVENIFFK